MNDENSGDLQRPIPLCVMAGMLVVICISNFGFTFYFLALEPFHAKWSDLNSMLGNCALIQSLAAGGLVYPVFRGSRIANMMTVVYAVLFGLVPIAIIFYLLQPALISILYLCFSASLIIPLLSSHTWRFSIASVNSRQDQPGFFGKRHCGPGSTPKVRTYCAQMFLTKSCHHALVHNV